MKKLFLISFCMFFITLLHAQTTVYCEIIGTQKFLSLKLNVEIDFGQSKSYNEKFLVDSDGKRMKFNSMVDALNFMGKLGWHFEQAYAVTHESQNVYHYLLSKDISNDESLTEGLRTRKNYNANDQDEESEEIEGNKLEQPKKKKIVDDIYH